MQVRDEVCGMSFEETNAAATTKFQRKTYHFCSERCRAKFEEHPDWYVPIETAHDGHDHSHH